MKKLLIIFSVFYVAHAIGINIGAIHKLMGDAHAELKKLGSEKPVDFYPNELVNEEQVNVKTGTNILLFASKVFFVMRNRIYNTAYYNHDEILDALDPSSVNRLDGSITDLISRNQKYRMEAISSDDWTGIHYIDFVGDYYLHMAQNPHTLLPSILGFYKYDGPFSFDAMLMFYLNVIPKDIEPVRPFLFHNKKSQQDTEAESAWSGQLTLGRIEYKQLMDTLRRDTEMLAARQLSDYKLRIGATKLPPGNNNIRCGAFGYLAQVGLIRRCVYMQIIGFLRGSANIVLSQTARNYAENFRKNIAAHFLESDKNVLVDGVTPVGGISMPFANVPTSNGDTGANFGYHPHTQQSQYSSIPPQSGYPLSPQPSGFQPPPSPPQGDYSFSAPSSQGF